MPSSETNDAAFPAILGGTPIRPSGPPDWPPADPALREVLLTLGESGDWGRYHGPYCERLQQQLMDYHDSAHAVLCASGTVAIELALRGLQVGHDDEVILSAYDFKANFQNVLAVGATPVLVDIEPDNWNLAVAGLADAVSSRTKAVIVSHLHGGVVTMSRVTRFAEEYGFPVIEDACQMTGATIEGRRAGTWGDVGVHSFGGSKLLTAGRGGAIISNRDDVVQRIRLYSQRGNEAYPLSEMQAAMIIPQLDQLDVRNARRADNVQVLQDVLERFPGLKIFQNTNHPTESQPAYFKVGLQYDPDQFDGLPREFFTAAMRAEGFAFDQGFRGLHRIHSRRRYRSVGDLQHASAADDGVVVLHHPILLETEQDLRQVSLALDKIRDHATMIQEKASIPTEPLKDST